ncbi:hypothetical protein U1Q18_018024 [Sarracenia purpurea var. burkii]
MRRQKGMAGGSRGKQWCLHEWENNYSRRRRINPQPRQIASRSKRRRRSDEEEQGAARLGTGGEAGGNSRGSHA